MSEQTIYYAFGTKRAVLSAALDLVVAGDDEPVPTLRRPWLREALVVTRPDEQIRRQVAGAGDIYRRAAPLLDVVRSAATAEPDLAAIWATNIVRECGQAEASRLCRQGLDQRPDLVARDCRDLAGRSLACWRRPGDDCVADVLIEVIG